VKACAGQVGSVVELLRGTFSNQVMQILATPKTGLFPAPREIQLSCTCPDWASMCKHVAAALYGVGARLDEAPEIFFTLRQRDQTELVTAATTAGTVARAPGKKAIAADSLADVFGIELADAPPAPPQRARPRKRRPVKNKTPKPRPPRRQMP
jgi:uncharacterized Zn finger protein